MRFPRDVAKTTITVYNYYFADNNPDKPTYKRTVIHDCLWNQNSSMNYKKTGIVNSDAVFICIPYDYNYQSVQNGEPFFGEGWTLNIGPEFSSSYIVKGECPFVFPEYQFSLGQTAEPFDNIIEGDEAVLYQDRVLLRDCIGPFEKKYQFKRPKEINEHFVGSRNLWFVEVRC